MQARAIQGINATLEFDANGQKSNATLVVNFDTSVNGQI